MSIRKKLKGFWSNRLSTKEQVEQELKDLPEAYDPEFKSGSCHVEILKIPQR